MTTEKLGKTCAKFVCEICSFKCSTLTDWNRHIVRLKHIKTTGATTEKSVINTYECDNCKKLFNDRAGHWRHKKICNFKEDTKTDNKTDNKKEDNEITSELILNIIQQNQEFKDLLIEQNKIIIEISKNNNTTNISTNNSHNKTFNLQVFLNETCKDAMNIMDFADSIKLQLTDLENVGEYGFVNGISKIIIKSLQEMDINLRPVHCSDLKREVAYVRENGKWEKDTPDNKLIKKAIKRVAHRNIRQIPEWKKLYPDCIFSDSNKSDQYNELTIESMGGRGDDDDGKANKIVRKIMKNVVIDKKML
jgi:hypothetical protein